MSRDDLFSSPRWGFLYLISSKESNRKLEVRFSSPRWGFLYLITQEWLDKQRETMFSSPLWGFFYLIIVVHFIVKNFCVLVPSLGILLFNNVGWDCGTHCHVFSSPLWGFFYLIKTPPYCVNVLEGSRPLPGDSFI